MYRKFFSIAIVVCFSMPLVLLALDDAHFIQDDDYFVSNQPYKQGWIYVDLAKMIQPAKPETKNEAQFMTVREGKELWTKYFFQSRIAAIGECKVGTIVICFNDNEKDEVYHAPEDKDSARNGSWFMARITDMSDLYKGYVTVSGGYKVNKENIRIILK
ncbi:MAG TPA: hypothetical protein PL059_02295 [Spirochaetota bacterium]|nr:hypothetical protein [Spirochaetota bacterium]HOM10388.1 hypothetical protein [Spirochaetota bacterium]HPP50202.1 hypothetical protein [Spirochaetota bacterium]